MIELLTIAAVLPPLLAAAFIGAGVVSGQNRGEAGEPQTALAAVGAAGLCLAAMLLLDTIALASGSPGQIDLGTWLSSGAIEVRLSFRLDALGLSAGTLVALICLITLRFSVNYMHREPGFQRFFLGLSLFTTAMLLIVTAGNAVLTFVGWELAGVCSFLLIAYAYDRKQAAINAGRAFITNRIGDAGFIVALFFLLSWLGTTEWPIVAERAPRLSSLDAGLILIGFLAAAFAKSAQVPFSGWIARALEGPTPSSAVFYGSLMVHAGIYLLIRLEPLFRQAPSLMPLVALVGLITALYGWLSGLAQTDVKSSLMFSTTAQVGLMTLACGLGWFDLAAWHLALNAVWRAYQFLHAPALLHLIRGPSRPVPGWLASRGRLYNAAMQRFWLDPFSDWLLVQPTKQIARDIQAFDDQVVNPLIGLPDQTNAVSSLTDWKSRNSTDHGSQTLSQGSGLLGYPMELLASILHWFEEHLVLRGGGEGLMAALHHLGGYVQRAEDLLSRPRYLLTLILITFVIIL